MRKQNSATIAITGASGFLGSTLVDYFTGVGWKVVALVRDSSKYPPKYGVKYIEYDLQKTLNKDAFRDVDYIVHAAYIKQDKRDLDALFININGAKHLLEVSRALNIKKNVFISSMSSHEDAVSTYGRQKLAIEKLFNTLSDVSLRPGLIIGNGGIVKTMSHFMKTKHIVPLISGGKQPVQIVNVNDLAKVIERVIVRNISGVLTIANPHVYTYKNFYETLSQYLKVRVIFLPVPFFLLKWSLRLTAILRLPLSINEDNLLGLAKLRAVDTKPDLEILGLKLDNLDTSLDNIN
jgi:nucleoside-diphosphate-sugar epimerase